MRLSFVFAAVLFVLTGQSNSVAGFDDSNILRLTKDNFDQAVREHKHLMVEFFPLPFPGDRLNGNISRTLDDLFVWKKNKSSSKIRLHRRTNRWTNSRRTSCLKICLSSFHIRRSVRLRPFILPDDLFVFQSIATQQLRSVSARSHPAPHDHVHFITTGPQDSDLCKSFEESYSEVARRLAEEGSKVRLAKVDTTVERELETKYVTDQDEERQTIKFFKEGLPITYHIKSLGPESPLKWIKRRTGLNAKILSSIAEFKELVEKEDVVAVGFFQNLNSSEAKAFLQAAFKFSEHDHERHKAGLNQEEERLAMFAVVTDQALAKQLNMKGDKVVLYREFDYDQRMEFDGTFEVSELYEFIHANCFPLVIEVTEETIPKLMAAKDGKIAVLVLRKKSSFREKFPHLSLFRKVAMGYRGRVMFVSLDPAKMPYDENILHHFDITESELPAFRIIQRNPSAAGGMKAYKPKNAEFSKQNIKSFVDDFLLGKLQPVRDEL